MNGRKGGKWKNEEVNWLSLAQLSIGNGIESIANVGVVRLGSVRNSCQGTRGANGNGDNSSGNGNDG
jgi:hypothetical protein